MNVVCKLDVWILCAKYVWTQCAVYVRKYLAQKRVSSFRNMYKYTTNSEDLLLPIPRVPTSCTWLRRTGWELQVDGVTNNVGIKWLKWCVRFVGVCKLNEVCECCVQIWCVNVLCKFGVWMFCANLVCECYVQIRCVNVLCKFKFGVWMLCAN